MATIISLDAARRVRAAHREHPLPEGIDPKQAWTLSLMDDILRNLGLPTWEERNANLRDGL